MSAALDYRELYDLIERLEPEQVEEPHRHALSLVEMPRRSRFRVLKSFEGPSRCRS
ncbi:hypothetical protein [Streptomyces marincola]|uniref:hypothetical protein n=1 Tax=Streptomyces marincola TaxID=2878388 RepID=UPI00131D724C|nr:hypothetical protein [Streptomyces marincola]